MGQDLENEIEIVEGLTGDEQVIANPGERMRGRRAGEHRIARLGCGKSA